MRYFFLWKHKTYQEISIHSNHTERLRLLANYQIILNRLMSIEKIELYIGDFENGFLSAFEPIFAFIRLNTLVLEGKFLICPIAITSIFGDIYF